ncbi:peroxisomal biogenesis factor 19 isoform X1 [Octopus sinensis]|uniref:Peroxin-19 n=1 Tax=Octopus sinensis TaxID=2607531 RepID=A0A7E6EUB8_9MOLL|nr:peroxisomal biogenesis factor 19 isoform X1 [Octopus sinensis]
MSSIGDSSRPDASSTSDTDKPESTGACTDTANLNKNITGESASHNVLTDTASGITHSDVAACGGGAGSLEHLLTVPTSALEATDSEVDDELIELLDSALQDFEPAADTGYATSALADNDTATQATPAGTTTSEVLKGDRDSDAANENVLQSSSSASYMSTPFNSPNLPHSERRNDTAGRDLAEQLDEAMHSFINEDPVLIQNIEILAKAAESAGDSPEAQKEFADTLAKTLSSLAQNAEGLQDQLNEEGLNQAFNNLGLNPGGGIDGGGNSSGSSGNNPDILPVMQNMMKTLLSKEVLYPSLKEISQKYPKWLEENSGKTDKKLIENYKHQYTLMKTICNEFEKETTTDSDDVKNDRFNKILEFMQEMQELGQPPKEILGEMAPGLEFDANGFPKLSHSGDQCSIM